MTTRPGFQTVMAANRRGWVTTMVFCGPSESRMYCGTWVVFPEPVEPWMMHTSAPKWPVDEIKVEKRFAITNAGHWSANMAPGLKPPRRRFPPEPAMIKRESTVNIAPFPGFSMTIGHATLLDWKECGNYD